MFIKFDEISVVEEPVAKWRNLNGHNLLDLMYKVRIYLFIQPSGSIVQGKGLPVYTTFWVLCTM